MRHKVKKVQLNLRKEHRNSLLRNLATSLVLYDKIKTTEARAKAVQPIVERLIKVAQKKDTMNAIRDLNKVFYDKNASRKMMDELKKRYEKQESGFTRITKLKLRDGDAATLVQLELIQ
jgi:large subunit ribosomal protein L17